MNKSVCVAPMMDCTDRHDRYFLRLISKNVKLYTEMIVANAIIKATNADAFSIAQNNGRAAKQIIPHVHVHIIPRYNDTGTLWLKRKILKDNELDELAQKIRNCIE